MDRVTMKGGSPTLLTIKPLNSPHTAPAARAARQATQMLTPIKAIWPAMTHVMAATPPTLSSMPPRIRARVSPMESRPSVATLRAMLFMLEGWMNFGLTMATMATTSKIMRNTLISRCRSNRFKSSGPVRFISLFCFIAATPFPQAARRRQAS